MPGFADIRPVQSQDDLSLCYALMRQLRPHLTEFSDFVRRWTVQQGEGYRLAALWDQGQVAALAGYRVQHNLVHDRHLYVDDLVTRDDLRGQGHGERLMDWLKAEAQRLECEKLILDTPLSNVLGHRFYYRQGLVASALRFNIPLTASARQISAVP